LRIFLRSDEDIRRQVTDEVLVGALGLPSDAVAVFVRDGRGHAEGMPGTPERRPLAIRSA
jgi:hypothetical protein